MSELEQLKRQHEALGKRIAKLECGKPASKPVDEPRGVTITYPVPPSTLVMPSDEQLHKLLDIVLAAIPAWHPDRIVVYAKTDLAQCHAGNSSHDHTGQGSDQDRVSLRTSRHVFSPLEA